MQTREGKSACLFRTSTKTRLLLLLRCSRACLRNYNDLWLPLLLNDKLRLRHELRLCHKYLPRAEAATFTQKSAQNHNSSDAGNARDSHTGDRSRIRFAAIAPRRSETELRGAPHGGFNRSLFTCESHKQFHNVSHVTPVIFILLPKRRARRARVNRGVGSRVQEARDADQVHGRRHLHVPRPRATCATTRPRAIGVHWDDGTSVGTRHAIVVRDRRRVVSTLFTARVARATSDRGRVPRVLKATRVRCRDGTEHARGHEREKECKRRLGARVRAPTRGVRTSHRGHDASTGSGRE